MSCNRAQSPLDGQIVIGADPCRDNTFARVDAHLENFFNKLSIVEEATDFKNEISKVVDMSADAVTGFVNSSLGSLTDKLTELIPQAIVALENFLKSLNVPIPVIIGIETPLLPLVKSLYDGLFCAATKVINSAKDTLTDLIQSAVKKVLTGAKCVTQQIIGGFANDMINTIDSIASPLLDPINTILDLFFNFDVKSFLTTGVGIARKIQNLFECDTEKVCPASSKYKLGQGIQKGKTAEEEEQEFKEIFESVSVAQNAENLITDFEKKYGAWEVFGSPLSESSSLGPCEFGNVTDCGLPSVDFFGGDGFGAAGNVILGNILEDVDTENIAGDITKIGSIVGVNITNPGRGYTRPPIISFKDKCNKGYGAFGRAKIDINPKSPTYGQVTSVVITSEGENYPANIIQDPLYVDTIIIENGGVDYVDGDFISEQFKIEVRSGKIVNVSPVPGFAFNGLPQLNIISDTGSGAILRPIMSVVPPQAEIIQVIDCIS